MTIRLLPTTINNLPLEVLPISFAHLNLTDLLTIERVCKTWHKVSITHNAIWEHIPYQKAIFVDRSAPIRAQVLLSFPPFCDAARKIFSKELESIPKNLSPIIEKQMIDERIATIDQALMDPLKALSDSLKMERFLCYPIKTGTFLIEECMKMMPVWVETGLLTINEDLLDHLRQTEGCLNRFDMQFASSIKLADNCIETQLKNETELPQYTVAFQKAIDEIKDINQAIFSLTQYILHFVEKPSRKLLEELIMRAAHFQLMPFWHQIALIRFAKRDTLIPLLENLNDDDWDHAFEQFMLNEGVNVNVEIHYPLFIQCLLRKMDKMDVQDLINSIPAPLNTDNVYTHYMHKQRHKDLQRSFLELKL